MYVQNFRPKFYHERHFKKEKRCSLNFCTDYKNAFALVLNLFVLMYLEFSPHLNVLLFYIICTLQGLAFQRKTYVHIHE